MLKYRQYLQQSRARRNPHQQTHLHYQPQPYNNYQSQGVSGQQIKSHENIKNFVSQPGYGEIFYSQDNNRKAAQNNVNANGNTNVPVQNQLKNYLESERSKTLQLKTYMTQLQQQNMELKNRLSQVLQQQSNSNKNIQSRNNFPQHIPQNYEDQQDQQYNNEPQHHQGYAQGLNHHAPQPSFNANTGQQFHNRPQPRLTGDYNSESSIPFVPSRVQHNQQSNLNYEGAHHSHNSHNSHHHSHHSHNHQAPSFVQPAQSQPLHQQYDAPVFMGSRQSLPINSAYPVNSHSQIQHPHPHPHPSQYIQPIQTRPQSPQQQQYSQQQYAQQYGGKNSASSLFTLAKQKLNAVKDDDEELRQYTIQLLRRS